MLSSRAIANIERRGAHSRRGAPAIQISTGKGCHLDAHMVAHGLDQLRLEQNGLLFIEIVGTLVCPAAFDLGEAHKVVVLSVTEGRTSRSNIRKCSRPPTCCC